MKDSLLYKRVFLMDHGDAQAVSKLAVALDDFRENVAALVSSIAADMPGYTVHDISHLDALWEIASLIAPGLDLNPAEAFVFGGAVLLHDSGMTLAAYPDRLNGLKLDPVYADALAYYLSGAGKESDESVATASATVEALRTLHAEKAQALATQSWRHPVSGDQVFLLGDVNLRAHYGELIGRIANSHHWAHTRLLAEFSEQLGSIQGCPIDWKVDPMKIALLLRCSDAAHIDHRRAPQMLYVLSQPKDVSETHWRFQNKLAKPHVQDAAIVYTSTTAFTAEEADAWYLAYDTIQMVDGELRSADEINIRRSGARFAVNGVRGADSQESLSQYIKVDGWRPLPVNLKVSDVTKLARTLGGADLYEFRYAPLRELIQNAADAIDARLAVDRDFSVDDAKISVAVEILDGEVVLSVSDNGVGMSERTLTNVLLDFGTSFWRSAEARQEMPGIGKALGKMRGRYGIGFFSVFMWAHNVSVISRRFRDQLDSTRVLEFKGGLASRPLVKIAMDGDRSSKWTTVVKLRIRGDSLALSAGTNQRSRIAMMRSDEVGDDSRSPTFWTEAVRLIGGLLPFSLEVLEGGSSTRVSIPDWRRCAPHELVQHFTPRFFGRDEVHTKFSEGMTEFRHGGEVVGRAFIVPSAKDDMRAQVAVYDKGIFVAVGRHGPVSGFVEGAAVNAARDRFSATFANDDPEWLESASYRAFGLCENEAETLAVQRSLAYIAAPDKAKPLFIVQRSICSYAEVLERVSKTKSLSIRLKQLSEDGFALQEATTLEPLFALRLDGNRLYPLINIGGSVDRGVNIEEYATSSESLLAKLLRDVTSAIGQGVKLSSRLVDVEGYRSSYIDIHARIPADSPKAT